MTIRFDHLLRSWYPRRDELEWVLATIIDTEHSTYRKSGAMMLVNGLGQALGMLSGGCLEGDLKTQARKALAKDQALIQSYDLREDSDSLWQQGLGCGGAMRVMLQPLHAGNGYLGLDQVHTAVEDEVSVHYWQRLDDVGLSRDCWRVVPETSAPLRSGTCVVEENQTSWLATHIAPSPHLLIMGGGQDARPLAAMAKNIGWRVSVADPRVGYARAEEFAGATVLKQEFDSLEHRHYDAIVIMSHSLSIDAAALRFAHVSTAAYVGLLGPEHRRQRVESLAGLSPKDFNQHYCGPAGVDIGARLPETIALAILAECHQVVEGSASASLAFAGVGNTILQ